jgi:hypothetical protein
MKYDISQHLNTPRNLTQEQIKKYVGDDTTLGTALLIGMLAGGALAVIMVIAALFGVAWKWAIIFASISAICYMVSLFTSKSGIAKRTIEYSNMPVVFMGLVTYWGRIFQKGTDDNNGLTVVVYSTDPVLMHDEEYINTIRYNMQHMLYNEDVSQLTTEEKKIYLDITNDDKGRYAIKDKTPVPTTRGSKGNTYLACIHFNYKDFPNAFEPEKDLVAYFLENNKPYTPLFSELYRLK